MDKTQQMLEKWCSGEGIEFRDEQAEEDYKKRIRRIADVIQLKIPDRVPLMPSFDMFSAFESGMTCEDVFFDMEKAYISGMKTLLEFQPDAFRLRIFNGTILEAIDCKQVKIPGRGISPNSGLQYIEDEYAKAEEFYDTFLEDPSDFVLRTLLPRICGSLEPLKNLPSFGKILGYPYLSGMLMSLGHPDLQEAFEKLFEIATQARNMTNLARQKAGEVLALGYPTDSGGGSSAPFDVIGDSIRGTQGIILDMYRCPDKLIAAMEKLVPIMIERGLQAKKSGNPLVSMPLHKGPDGFMSDEQYRTFYWPTLRKVMIGLIDEGLIPVPFFEGDNTSRLEIISDIPRGKALYRFERVDLNMAKEILGDTVAFRGNVPISLLNTGTPEDVKTYVKNLIDVVGKNGGLIVDSGSVINEARHENIKAMIEFTKEYGRY